MLLIHKSLWMLIVFQAILNLNVENIGNNLFSTYIFFVSICFYFFLISSKTETSDQDFRRLLRKVKTTSRGIRGCRQRGGVSSYVISSTPLHLHQWS